MRVKSGVHQIKVTFHVTPQIERFVYIYLITGKNCYLIDAGVDGAENVIADYMGKIGRDIREIKSILLTHSHPDHIGSAAKLKSMTGCMIYASQEERDWIEDIDKQYRERPIPNFKELLKESVRVDEVVGEGSVLELEEGITIKVTRTAGHSAESLSYYLLKEHILFTGDAIPVAGDIPIYISAKQSMDTLHKIRQLADIDYYCPAWDSVYMGREGIVVIDRAIRYLGMIDDTVRELAEKYPENSEDELFGLVCERRNMVNFTQNPLFRTSIVSNIRELKAGR